MSPSVVRRRACAAMLLCGPLVAGCGAVASAGFRPHSRPAAPLEVSVLAGARGITLDPSQLRAGPALFNIANQSGRPERFSVRTRKGRLLARSPTIAAGQTAQLKATLVGPGDSLRAYGRSGQRSIAEHAGLSVTAPARNGDNDAAQP